MTDNPPRSPDEIVEEYAKQFGVRPSDITGGRRFHHLTLPKAFVAYELRAINGWSYGAIGDFLGGRDHSTTRRLVQIAAEYADE